MKNKQRWRQKFRDEVFTRDKNECKICKSKAELDAHHITDRHEMPNGGYVLSNGITLCIRHHFLAEQFHIHNKLKWVEGLHPNDLYKLIDSSYEKAYNDSSKLIKL